MNLEQHLIKRYQGDKLANRFNAFTYWIFSKAMDSHNVSRGRDSAEKVLNAIQANTLVIGIESDILFPISEQQFLAKHIPEAELAIIESDYGHDGFLVEFEQLNKILLKFLNKKTSGIKLPASSHKLLAIGL